VHLKSVIATTILISAVIRSATPALAVVNLVTNGGFETNGGNGQLGYNTTATGCQRGGN
jgi:hypothetical protein